MIWAQYAQSIMAVGKRIILLLITVPVAGCVLFFLSHPSRFVSTGNLQPSTTVQRDTIPEEDIGLLAHNSATEHVVGSTAPPTLCNDECVPCSKTLSSCPEVIAAEPHTRPKRQYNKRKVLFSTDIKNLFFTWFVPITSLLWYEKMGWQPVLFIVYISEEDFTPRINLIIKYAIATGIEVHKYKHILDTSRYPMMVTLTSIRFAACTFDWPEDTYVLTSDVDMWPLNADFYNKETSYNTSVHILNANHYGNPKFADEYPACYIGMKLSMWREVMNCTKGQDVMSFLAELRDFAGDGPWGSDQRAFTMRLKHWSGFPDSVHFTSRNPRVDRIDRTYHKNNYVWAPHKVEAHVLRPAFTAQNWPRIRTVLSHVLDQDEMEWIDGYAEHICSFLSCSNATVTDSYKGMYRTWSARIWYWD